MMYCELYKDKILPEGQPPIARGKVVWIDKDSIMPVECGKMFCVKPTEDSLQELKECLRAFFSKKNFIFFDECVYRYKLNTNGLLKEFGINFHHIK